MKRTIKIKGFKARVYIYKTRKEMIKAINKFLCCDIEEVEDKQAAQTCVFESFDTKGNKKPEIIKAYFSKEDINEIVLIHEALHISVAFVMSIEKKQKLILPKVNVWNEEKISYCQGYVYRKLKEWSKSA